MWEGALASEVLSGEAKILMRGLTACHGIGGEAHFNRDAHEVPNAPLGTYRSEGGGGAGEHALSHALFSSYPRLRRLRSVWLRAHGKNCEPREGA